MQKGRPKRRFTDMGREDMKIVDEIGEDAEYKDG